MVEQTVPSSIPVTRSFIAGKELCLGPRRAFARFLHYFGLGGSVTWLCIRFYALLLKCVQRSFKNQGMFGWATVLLTLWCRWATVFLQVPFWVVVTDDLWEAIPSVAAIGFPPIATQDFSGWGTSGAWIGQKQALSSGWVWPWFCQLLAPVLSLILLRQSNVLACVIAILDNGRVNTEIAECQKLFCPYQAVFCFLLSFYLVHMWLFFHVSPKLLKWIACSGSVHSGCPEVDNASTCFEEQELWNVAQLEGDHSQYSLGPAHFKDSGLFLCSLAQQNDETKISSWTSKRCLNPSTRKSGTHLVIYFKSLQGAR